MRRLLVATLFMAIGLAACAWPSAKAESPDQAVSAAALKMGGVKTVKFDLTGTAQLQIPPSLSQALSPQGTSQLPPGLTLDNIAIDVKDSGAVKFPDQAHMSLEIHFGGFTVNTEEVVFGPKLYVKDPVSSKWISVAGIGADQFGSQFIMLDPLSATEFLNAYQSLKDLGDTAIGNVSVHHYQLTPDKAKLAARLDQSPALQNPQARAALRQVLEKGTLSTEIWIGKDDHLLRRVSADGEVSVDLSQLFAAFGSVTTPSGRPGASPRPSLAPVLPPGSDLRIKGHAVLDFHDFDTPVTITEPKVS